MYKFHDPRFGSFVTVINDKTLLSKKHLQTLCEMKAKLTTKKRSTGLLWGVF